MKRKEQENVWDSADIMEPGEIHFNSSEHIECVPGGWVWSEETRGYNANIVFIPKPEGEYKFKKQLKNYIKEQIKDSGIEDVSVQSTYEDVKYYGRFRIPAYHGSDYERIKKITQEKYLLYKGILNLNRYFNLKEE